jgi:hypothetical protein
LQSEQQPEESESTEPILHLEQLGAAPEATGEEREEVHTSPSSDTSTFRPWTGRSQQMEMIEAISEELLAELEQMVETGQRLRELARTVHRQVRMQQREEEGMEEEEDDGEER